MRIYSAKLRNMLSTPPPPLLYVSPFEQILSIPVGIIQFSSLCERTHIVPKGMKTVDRTAQAPARKKDKYNCLAKDLKHNKWKEI